MKVIAYTGSLQISLHDRLEDAVLPSGDLFGHGGPSRDFRLWYRVPYNLPEAPSTTWGISQPIAPEWSFVHPNFGSFMCFRDNDRASVADYVLANQELLSRIRVKVNIS